MPCLAACTSCNHAIFGSHQSILTEKDNYGVGPSVDFCDFQRKTVFVMSSHCVTIFRIFQRQKSYLFWSGIIEPRFVNIQILVPDLQSPKESSKFYYKGLSATVPLRKSKITYCVCMSFLSWALDGPTKLFRQTFYDLLPRKFLTEIGLISLDILKIVPWRLFLKLLFLTGLAHDIRFFTVTIIYSIRKSTSSKKLGNVLATRFKC